MEDEDDPVVRVLMRHPNLSALTLFTRFYGSAEDANDEQIDWLTGVALDPDFVAYLNGYLPKELQCPLSTAAQAALALR